MWGESQYRDPVFSQTQRVDRIDVDGRCADLMAGNIEVEESKFGGVRKGKRGRGAAGKIPIFGLLKRRGHVYAGYHSKREPKNAYL